MKISDKVRKTFLVLAVTGDLLVWFPIMAPILLTVFAYIRIQRFRFDYLMPAELFLSVLLGAILLIIVSLKTKRRQKLIIGSISLMIVLLFGGQALAMVTGLASGETEMGGWEWALVLGAIIGYDLLVAALGIAGILLIRDLQQANFFSDSDSD